MKIPSVDPLGQAIHDYYTFKINHPLIIHSEDFDDDEMNPSYFFRGFKEMPELEKKALKLCRGKILDVGACAGSHTIWLQENGFDVTALEISELCCDTMRKRGVRNIINDDLFLYNGETYDTILLLMNGTGIAGTLPRLSNLFVHLKKLLRQGGQILIDSSDLIYLYEDDKGFVNLDSNSKRYYGELKYQFEYKGIKSDVFPWLYTDIETMTKIVSENQLKVKQLIKGKHFDFLMQIEK